MPHVWLGLLLREGRRAKRLSWREFGPSSVSIVITTIITLWPLQVIESAEAVRRFGLKIQQKTENLVITKLLLLTACLLLLSLL